MKRKNNPRNPENPINNPCAIEEKCKIYHGGHTAYLYCITKGNTSFDLVMIVDPIKRTKVTVVQSSYRTLWRQILRDPRPPRTVINGAPLAKTKYFELADLLFVYQCGGLTSSDNFAVTRQPY
ncbi:hypothetical protein [Ralstonia mannitolilytica]|uniref:hypothetical protein n=1 Tax=Ralstonia mannitolilytica TaxID=105219 RepID=UPI0028F5AFB1|nr:hypothetical protein [Ralstonia mannitolilytica]CAJ0719342.1 hypothetical protein LMG8323_04244 [Ralstonia mannitolilytica]